MSGTDYTLTPNYGLYKPIPNADGDQWGGHWNQNADTLDSKLYSASAGVINVRDFYTGNWDTAFDAAFAALPATGGTIRVPAGSYTWGAPRVWANKPVSLVGDGKGISNITISHAGVGLTINQTGTNAIFNRTNIAGLTFYAGASSGPTQGVVAVNYPNGASWPVAFSYATFGAAHIEMLSSTGTSGPTWGSTFRTGITITGGWSAILDDIHFFGVPTNPGIAGSYGIGLAQCEDTHIARLYVHYGQAGVSILDHGEGLELTAPTFVGTDWAINVATGATNWPSPAFLLWNLIQITNGECNTYLGIVNIHNVQNCTIAGSDLTRFQDSGASNWTVAQLTDCNWCTIVDNFVSGGGATQSTNRYAVLTSTPAWGCFNNRIDNQVVAGQMGVWSLFSGTPDPSTNNLIAWTQDTGARGYSQGQKYANSQLIISNGQALRLADATGAATTGIVLQSDNNLVVAGSASTGAQRVLATMAQHSDTSVFSVAVPVLHGSTVGFNNTAPIAKPTVTGSKGANAALASLMTALAAYGLVTDSTT